jgi:BlaI family penicillinase repressor
MPRPPSKGPTDVELDILGDLWGHGPSTLGEVHGRLGLSRGTGYTTTQRMLNIMAEKGLLDKDDSVRPAVYRAVKSKQKTQQGMMKRLQHTVFGGSATKMLVQLLSSKDISREDLQEVKRLIRELEKKQKS